MEGSEGCIWEKPRGRDRHCCRDHCLLLSAAVPSLLTSLSFMLLDFFFLIFVFTEVHRWVLVCDCACFFVVIDGGCWIFCFGVWYCVFNVSPIKGGVWYCVCLLYRLLKGVLGIEVFDCVVLCLLSKFFVLGFLFHVWVSLFSVNKCWLG